MLVIRWVYINFNLLLYLNFLFEIRIIVSINQIWLLESNCRWPKVILLSGAHCIRLNISQHFKWFLSYPNTYFKSLRFYKNLYFSMYFMKCNFCWAKLWFNISNNFFGTNYFKRKIGSPLHNPFLSDANYFLQKIKKRSFLQYFNIWNDFS